MDAIELLHTRASAKKLQEPGPGPEHLDAIFRSAVRAPDHGRRRPWRFIVIDGDRRERLGDVMVEIMKADKPDTPPDMLAREREKALRAPLIIVTVARVKTEDKIPEVEQLLSVGAAAQNIMLAAHALGYGAMWKTGDVAYDERMKQALGLEPGDSIVGFIYVGTPVKEAMVNERPRPSPADYVSTWQGSA
jgi:nitroreductase